MRETRPLPPEMGDGPSGSDRPAMPRRAFDLFVSHARVPLHRNAYALITSAGLTSLLGFAYWAVAARSYSPRSIGIQSSALSAMIFLSGVAQLSLNNTLVRFVPVAGASTRRLVLWSYAVSAFTGAAAAVIFVAGTHVWTPSLHVLRTEPMWFLSFVLATSAWCVSSLQDSVLTSFREALWVPLENTLVSLVKIVLLLMLMDALPGSGVFASWNIPIPVAIVLVNLLIFGRFLPRHAAGDASATLRLSSVVRFALGNYVGSLFWIASTNLMPLVVLNGLGATAAAYFFLPWALFNGLQFVTTSIGLSLTVEAVVDPARLRAYLRRSLVQAVTLVIPVASVLALAAPQLLKVFGGEYAREGTALLRWLVAAAVPSIVVALGLALGRIQSRSSVVGLIQASGCVLLLVPSYLLLPRMGIAAVGVAAFMSQTLVAIVLLATSLRMLYSPTVEPRHTIG